MKNLLEVYVRVQCPVCRGSGEASNKEWTEWRIQFDKKYNLLKDPTAAIEALEEEGLTEPKKGGECSNCKGKGFRNESVPPEQIPSMLKGLTTKTLKTRLPKKVFRKSNWWSGVNPVTSLGEFIKQHSEERGLQSATVLAKQAGLSLTTVSSLVTGRRRASERTVMHLFKRLGLDWDTPEVKAMMAEHNRIAPPQKHTIKK